MNKDKNNLLERLKALENKVNLQENEINNLKSELKTKNGKITNLEKTLKEQRDEIEEIKNWKNKYESELEYIQINKVNSITLNNIIDSKIINKIEEIEFL